MSQQCAYCLAPANSEKPQVYGSAPSCDRHCGYSATGSHDPDRLSLDTSDVGMIYVTCRWCGQAGLIRRADIGWL